MISRISILEMGKIEVGNECLPPPKFVTITHFCQKYIFNNFKVYAGRL